MVKSPLEYFADQDFDLEPPAHQGVNDTEKAFIQKYMGLSLADALEAVPQAEAAQDSAQQGAGQGVLPGLTQKEPAQVSQETTPSEPLAEEEGLLEKLRSMPSVQFVGFYIGPQLFALPTLAIQEVIRKEPVWALPLAPKYIRGVINLRGRITPLIKLRDLLDVAPAKGQEAAFTIICRSKGLQFGIEIERLQSMYRIPQEELNWDAETSIGANVEFINGMFVQQDKIIPVVNVERLVEHVVG